MGAGKKGLNGGSTQQRDAAEWIAENGSDRAVDEATVSLWEEWIARPSNQVEYVAMIGLLERVRAAPAPTIEGREALVRDALMDVGDG
jgi:hypothetical protein